MIYFAYQQLQSAPRQQQRGVFWPESSFDHTLSQYLPYVYQSASPPLDADIPKFLDLRSVQLLYKNCFGVLLC